MKKIAILVAAACAMGLGTAAQADGVTLYGSVSTGVLLAGNSTLKAGTDNATVRKSENRFTEESAWYGDSLWGLTGEESLGNGWKVGFTLENNFNSDDGQLSTDKTLFDGQAYLKVTNDVFTVAAGNIGGLASAGGDFDLVGGFDPMEAAFGVGGMGVFGSRDLTLTNSLLFQVTPVDGLTLSAMGSFGSGDDGDTPAKWKDRDHYYGFGALYEANDLSLGAVVEATTYSNAGDNKDASTSWTYTVGAAYDFGVVRPSVMYQHGQKAMSFQDYSFNGAYYNYDAFLLGASAPLGDGTLKAAAQYLNGKLKDGADSVKANAFVLGAAYVYDLSKRTSLYFGATYAWGDKALDKDGNSSNDFARDDAEETYQSFNDFRASLNGYQVGFGLNHTF